MKKEHSELWLDTIYISVEVTLLSKTFLDYPNPPLDLLPPEDFVIILKERLENPYQKVILKKSIWISPCVLVCLITKTKKKKKVKGQSRL